MPSIDHPLASIIIVTYNHRQYLQPCLDSVQRQQFPHETIVVDNQSADGTAAFVREHYPGVRVIENPENNGYGAGNNLGVAHAQGNIIVILNPDVTVHQDWLEHLVSPLIGAEGIITTPKILLYDGRTINTCGNINHFTGLTFTRGLGQDPGAMAAEEEVTGISGACFALRKADYDAIGGFDERFFVYNEDADFSWRANILGWSIRYIPDSLVFHDYQLRLTPGKIYNLEKGRYMILRKYLSGPHALLLAPSLGLAEILTTGYALKMGAEGLRQKIRAVHDGLTVESRPLGKDPQALFARLTSVIPEEQLASGTLERLSLRLANYIFRMNYAVFRAVVG